MKGETKRYYWLKLKNDFFINKKIKKLRKIAGGDTYTIIYLKMQLLSITNEGKIYYENVEDTFADELALELDEDVENVQMTLMYLIENGLLVEVNNEEYLLPEAQESIGSETSKAELMRKKRAKDKVVGNNVTDVLPEVTKSYIEIEKEKEKKKDIEYFANTEINSLFTEFINQRKKLKAVNSERAINTLINKLNKYDDETKYKMIENSIVNSWKDVYELKDNKKTGTKDVPEWFDKKVEKVEASEEELNEIEELLKDFK